MIRKKSTCKPEKEKKYAIEMHDAVRRGSLNEIKKLLKKTSVTAGNNAQQSPLHTACIEGHLNITTYLIRKKADVNATDRDGWTPLHCACHSGNLKIVELLISYNAEVCAETANNSVPLDYFVRIPDSSTPTLVFENIFRTMVRKGAKVNRQNHQSETPLHIAAARGKYLSLNLLLKHQSNPNIQNKNGETPLHLATRGGFVKSVELLLNTNADWSIAGNNGHCLKVAESTGDSNITELYKKLLGANEYEKALLGDNENDDKLGNTKSSAMQIETTLVEDFSPPKVSPLVSDATTPIIEDESELQFSERSPLSPTYRTTGSWCSYAMTPTSLTEEVKQTITVEVTSVTPPVKKASGEKRFSSKKDQTAGSNSQCHNPNRRKTAPILPRIPVDNTSTLVKPKRTKCNSARPEQLKSLRTPKRKRNSLRSRCSSSRQSSAPTEEFSVSAGSTPRTSSKRRKRAVSEHSRYIELNSQQPKNIGPYTVGECIGSGGFGNVFTAFDKISGAIVAIKQISLYGIPQDELDTVLAELKLLQRLEHKNITKYIGFLRTEEYLNIILEFVEGGSLSAIITRYGGVVESLCARYVAQTLFGLCYLHNMGIIHRDIKCANILVTKDGLIKLADFGIASVHKSTDADDSDTVQMDATGSPYWMAPEVIQLQGASPASDIWSLGCTIIELLCGKPPYSDLGPMAALFAMVKHPRPQYPSEISNDLEDFLNLCFVLPPDKRQSAKELLQHNWLKTHASDIINPEWEKLV